MVDEPPRGSPHSASDFGAAAAMLGASRDKADAFLDEQIALTKLQREDLHEQRGLEVERLRGEIRNLRLQSRDQAVMLGLKAIAGLFVLFLAAGLVAMVWSAAHDNGLVIESFSVPPDLAARGLSGQVVATRLLDKLASLQEQTVSNRAGSSYANNWGSDIKVQIPDTGVSIGEVNRYLRAWLGHETIIAGEIYRTPTGLALTARAGAEASPTFTGSEADLDKLLQQGAEAVYAQTQPYRYAVYLANANRQKEAEATYQKLIAGGSPLDRAWAYVGMQNLYDSRGEFSQGERALKKALGIKPDFVMSYMNLAANYGQFQRDEASFNAEKKAVELLLKNKDTDISEGAATSDLLSNEATLASDLGDYRGQIEFNRQLELIPSFFANQLENSRQNDAFAYASLHDPAAMREVFDSFAPTNVPQIKLSREGNRAFGDLLTGNAAPILRGRAKFDAFLAKLGPAGSVLAKRQFWPFVAFALALTGDFKAAHALIDKTPADCTICLRVRGRIDAFERNYAGADYWFARAVHDAPSTPFSYTDWGQARLRKGDADGAIALFQTAHSRGPLFADPLEMWGEALILKSRSDLAVAKFQEAGKYAPHWGRLHLKWGEALLWSGSKSEAEKQFAIAAKLHLTPSEKSELAKRRKPY